MACAKALRYFAPARGGVTAFSDLPIYDSFKRLLPRPPEALGMAGVLPAASVFYSPCALLPLDRLAQWSSPQERTLNWTSFSLDSSLDYRLQASGARGFRPVSI